MRINFINISIIWIIAVTIISAQEKEFPKLTNPYLGQEPPGRTPEIFAPGIVSREDRYELMSAFSPNGKEFCFTVTKRKWSDFKVWCTKYELKQWSEFKLLPLSLSMSGFGPVYSPSGDSLYFSSPDWYTTPTNIFYCVRTKTSWGKPFKFNVSVNSDYNEWQFSMAKDKTIVFTSNRPGGKGDYDLYISEMGINKYKDPVNLENLNSEEDEYSVFIAPGKDYIIFSSQRKDGYGWDDLFISFRTKDESWTDPINFGPTINTEHAEFAPHISPDGEYLFFSKWDINSDWSDIYWVDAKIVEELKPDGLIK